MPLSRSEQARINGAKSRGPKTPQGKARSAQNALKHGRYAINAIVLSNEDPGAFEELVGHYVRRIQPADQVEYHLTRELASIQWRLTRNFALETRLLDHEMDIQSPALNSAGLSVAELTRLLNASRATVERSQFPNYLARREGQLLRARQSVLAFLRDLRKNFPLAESAPEVIPSQPLNPEFPIPNEPETNPKSGVDPLVRAEPPGSACAIHANPPRAGSSSEVIPPQCLNPDYLLRNRPETNPKVGRAVKYSFRGCPGSRRRPFPHVATRLWFRIWPVCLRSIWAESVYNGIGLGCLVCTSTE
jgi:hypothetical protein